MASFVGLVLGPPVGGMLALVTAAIVYGNPDLGLPGWHMPSIETIVSHAIIGCMAGAYFGILPAVFIGWPLQILMIRIAFTDPFTYGCVGASIAVASCRFIAMPIIGPSADQLQVMAVSGLAGALGAVVLWGVRRPDLDRA